MRLEGVALRLTIFIGITARKILTREAFENAIAVVMAFGGPTNAVLHLLAIAHEAGVGLQLDDFNRVGDKVPHLVVPQRPLRGVLAKFARLVGSAAEGALCG